jgi:hypothetical protein
VVVTFPQSEAHAGDGAAKRRHGSTVPSPTEDLRALRR